MEAVELFGGVGGLALGCDAAGFDHAAFVECDSDACATVRANQQRGLSPLTDWNVLEKDVADIDYSTECFSEPELLAGGPPCQPFSLGGNHKGNRDKRNMFPQTVRAVRELRPMAFVFENVRGLLRTSFRPYFDYILLQLTYPDVRRHPEEPWQEHQSRLQSYANSNNPPDLTYDVQFQLMNAADFGVPQKRHRVFIVGFRQDLGVEWTFPKPTHSKKALLWSQWIDRSYWRDHHVAEKNRPAIPSRYQKKVDTLRSSLFEPQLSPWQTVRDAFDGLADPRTNGAETLLNHDFKDGARVYPGHTGSPIDWPSKTLKAGDHGVPGGENMTAFHDGTVRYFTVRESARLQTFPDDYFFPGSWTASMRQLGNAVPVQLANVVVEPIGDILQDLQAVDVQTSRAQVI